MTPTAATGSLVAVLILVLVLVTGAGLSVWFAWTMVVRLRRSLRRREGWLRALPWAILLPIAALFAGGMIYFIVSLVGSLAR